MVAPEVFPRPKENGIGLFGIRRLAFIKPLRSSENTIYLTTAGFKSRYPESAKMKWNLRSCSGSDAAPAISKLAYTLFNEHVTPIGGNSTARDDCENPSQYFSALLARLSPMPYPNAKLEPDLTTDRNQVRSTTGMLQRSHKFKQTLIISQNECQ